MGILLTTTVVVERAERRVMNKEIERVQRGGLEVQVHRTARVSLPICTVNDIYCSKHCRYIRRLCWAPNSRAKCVLGGDSVDLVVTKLTGDAPLNFERTEFCRCAGALELCETGDFAPEIAAADRCADAILSREENVDG